MSSFAFEFHVDRSPQVVWSALCNVRAWWSQEIDGTTDRSDAEFQYHYQDVHRCSFRISEFVPPMRMVWHVLANEFNFTKDKTEWVGTDVIFELVPEATGTRVLFCHQGLVPAYECYEVCRDAWTGYLGGSLRNLILTGQGQPNPIEAVVTRAQAQRSEDFQFRLNLPVAPGVVLQAIERPEAWWSQTIRGSVARLGDEFEFRYKDQHWSRHRVTRRIPGRLAVWEVTDSRIAFVKDQEEWTGTALEFEVLPRDGGTDLVFTHRGLSREKECFGACVEGWNYFLGESLKSLVLTGTGNPEAN